MLQIIRQIMDTFQEIWNIQINIELPWNITTGSTIHMGTIYLFLFYLAFAIWAIKKIVLSGDLGKTKKND